MEGNVKNICMILSLYVWIYLGSVFLRCVHVCYRELHVFLQTLMHSQNVDSCQNSGFFPLGFLSVFEFALLRQDLAVLIGLIFSFQWSWNIFFKGPNYRSVPHGQLRLIKKYQRPWFLSFLKNLKHDYIISSVLTFKVRSCSHSSQIYGLLFFNY